MADDLGTVDVTHLEALAKLEADQRAIRALAEKAAWHRDKVAEVYSRVVRDYEARILAVEEQAQVIRQRVRDDLRSLDAMYDRCRTAVEQARVEMQESEFRHEIGEFSREEFQRRQQAGERAIAERREELDTVAKLRARCAELLPNEPFASEPPAPPAVTAAAGPEPAVAEPPSLPVVTPPPASTGATLVDGVAGAPATLEEPGPPPEGAACFVPPPSSEEFQAPPPPGSVTEQFGTVAVAAATLTEDRNGLPGASHRLGMRTTIGRTADNQIVVPIREVSRRHAEISLTERGYFVKDLGSPNGTFVNGERVTERVLQDGDRIAMGGQVFVFKAR
jgi:hypothetical protein